VALLALGAALAGCGSGGGETASTSATQAQSPPPQVVVEASSNGFDPAKIFRETSPGVVTIRSILNNGAAEGSGFVLDKSGRIVTNAHVVTEEFSSGRELAKAVFVELPERNVVPAKIVGVDPFADVALLEVEPAGLDLHPLEMGSDQGLVVGQPVAVIGSPFAEPLSLSVGVVSAINRSVRSLTKFQIEGAIQTDASINPGNSGGPMLEAQGKVIGLAEQIATQSGADEGVGFAIPISSVKRSIPQLEENGKAEYAYIGVSTQALYPQLAEKLKLGVDYGGLIAEVVPGAPADKAGLRGGDGKLRFQGLPYRSGGDVIIAVDGRRVVRPEDLARYIASFQPGEQVTLKIVRDGNTEEVPVTLGRRPGGEGGG
jgi:S1-C subfamily serine protease